MPAVQLTKVAFALALALVVAPVQAVTRVNATKPHRHSMHSRKLAVSRSRPRRGRLGPSRPPHKLISAKTANTGKPAVRVTESNPSPQPVTASGYVCPGMICPGAPDAESFPRPCLMTVSICRKSGLLAGPHCEAHGGPVEEQVFTVGDQPEEHCEQCMPPPPPPAPDPAPRLNEAREATLLAETEPDVPEELTGVHGAVTVRFWVDERGRVVDPAVVCSSGSMALDECAIRAVQRFRYAPAEQEGARRIPAEKTFRF